MHRDNGYFSASGYRDKLMPGKELNILHSIDFREYYVGQSDMPELVLKTEDELEAMRQESVEKETGIYEKLRTDTVQWEDQAGRTLLLERALEYVRTPEVKHTGNQWKRLKNGNWEISNRVYIMRYRFSPATYTDKKTKQDVNGYRVDWGIVFNTPAQPASNRYAPWGDSIYITRQDKKFYPTLEAAQKYIQSRFDLYAYLFEELSPPIPYDNHRFFEVNGHLLPGYTLQAKDKVQAWEIDTLLDCLEEDDPGGTPQEQKEETPVAEEAAPTTQEVPAATAPAAQDPPAAQEAPATQEQPPAAPAAQTASEHPSAKPDTPAETGKRLDRKAVRKDMAHKKKRAAMAR